MYPGYQPPFPAYPAVPYPQPMPPVSYPMPMPVNYPPPMPPPVAYPTGAEYASTAVSVAKRTNPNLAIAGLITLVLGGTVIFLVVRKDVKKSIQTHREEKAKERVNKALDEKDPNALAADDFLTAVGGKDSASYLYARTIGGDFEKAKKAAGMVTKLSAVEKFYKDMNLGSWFSGDLWADLNAAFWDSQVNELKEIIRKGSVGRLGKLGRR